MLNQQSIELVQKIKALIILSANSDTLNTLVTCNFTLTEYRYIPGLCIYIFLTSRAMSMEPLKLVLGVKKLKTIAKCLHSFFNLFTHEQKGLKVVSSIEIADKKS